MVLEKDRFKMYVAWIVNAINEIQGYVKGITFEKFEKDNKTINACLMLLIHIGETANKMNKKYPKFDKIPHPLVIGLRNLIAHDYMEVNMARIWDTIKNDLPVLKKELLDSIK